MMPRHRMRVISPVISKVYSIFIISGFLAGVVFPFSLPAIAHADDTIDTTSRGFPNTLLYLNSSKSGIDSLRAHIGSVDIIAPQSYAAMPDGVLLGSVTNEVLKLAHESGAEIMPLVVNQNFSQAGMDTFLKSDAAQNKLLTSMIAEAKSKGYIGFQYDFEHMMASDKDRYSAFVAKSATLFHLAGLQLSVAVAPKQSDLAADDGVSSYQNWTGAFDYQALGASADFLSVMAYDDSKSDGPPASLPWVTSVLNYTLSRVPADKVSLGVAFYGWAINDKTGTLDHIVTYPEVADLIASGAYIKQGWSDTLGSSYVEYRKDGKTLTAWYEDEKSFQEKLALATGDNLRGISGWAIGQEAPGVWTALSELNASPDLAFR